VVVVGLWEVVGFLEIVGFLGKVFIFGRDAVDGEELALLSMEEEGEGFAKKLNKFRCFLGGDAFFVELDMMISSLFLSDSIL